MDKTFYTTDGSAPTTSSAVYDPAAKPKLADGQRIRYFSRDRVGNVEPVKSSPVVQSTTRPRRRRSTPACLT